MGLYWASLATLVTPSLGQALTRASTPPSWQLTLAASAPLPVALALATAWHCCLAAVVAVLVAAAAEWVAYAVLVVAVRRHGLRYP